MTDKDKKFIENAMNTRPTWTIKLLLEYIDRLVEAGYAEGYAAALCWSAKTRMTE